MRRSLLFSCALHGVILVIALATAPRRAVHDPAGVVEIAVDGAQPAIPNVPLLVAVEEAEHRGGGGPARPAEAAVVQLTRAPHRRRVAIHGVRADTPPLPEPAEDHAAPTATDEGVVEVARGAATAGPSSAPSDGASGAGNGAGAGNGLGDGLGDGFGPGAGGGEMSRELHARVLSNEELDVRPREGTPTLSHDESTALRTRDRFPRLPESVWPEWRPYVVRLEICVGEDGDVREVVLRSSASPRLDPVVVAAAKTWQYRPRFVDGKATPFCHGVVIKYERW